MNKHGLPQRTIDELLDYFLSNPEIEKVLIFGSRAKGTYHAGSDIDFAIWTKDHENFFKISARLDELPTPYKFDIIDYRALMNEGLKTSIDNDGILFYEKK